MLARTGEAWKLVIAQLFDRVYGNLKWHIRGASVCMASVLAQRADADRKRRVASPSCGLSSE